MIVLKIIGWVILGILALVILALFVRVGIQVEYSDKKTSAVLSYLFIKIPLYPKEKKKKVEKKKEEEKEEEPEKEKTDKPAEKKKKKEGFLHMLYRTNGIDGILLLLKRILSYTGTFFGNLIRGVVVDELNLDVACVKKDDAAATAIYYGEVCSALFPMLGALASKCRMKKHDINVYPDYLARYSDASFFIKLHVTPMYMIGITVAYVFKLLFKVIGRMFVKIFMSEKNSKTENSDITKNKEKSEKKV